MRLFLLDPQTDISVECENKIKENILIWRMEDAVSKLIDQIHEETSRPIQQVLFQTRPEIVVKDE